MTRKEPARDQRLQQLKAFGLFIRGEHTLYQIAEALGIAAQNPSSAASRARTRIEQGWRVICERRVLRWQRWWAVAFPQSQWQTLSGARLWTHPVAMPAPPLTEPTPLERLLGKLKDVEAEAEAAGFAYFAEGLRNMAAAVRHHSQQRDAFSGELKFKGRPGHE